MISASHGSWRSAITSDLIVADSIALADAWLDDLGEIYWLADRPDARMFLPCASGLTPIEQLVPFDNNFAVREPTAA